MYMYVYNYVNVNMNNIKLIIGQRGIEVGSESKSIVQSRL